jgi:hypothetical protein
MRASPKERLQSGVYELRAWLAGLDDLVRGAEVHGVGTLPVRRMAAAMDEFGAAFRELSEAIETAREARRRAKVTWHDHDGGGP